MAPAVKEKFHKSDLLGSGSSEKSGARQQIDGRGGNIFFLVKLSRQLRMEFRVHHHHPVALRQGQEVLILHGLLLEPVAQPEAQRQIEQRQGQQGDEPIGAPQPDKFDGRATSDKAFLPCRTNTRTAMKASRPSR